jgi:hypothetical protein
MHRLLQLIIGFCIFLLLPVRVFAVEVTIVSSPDTITQDPFDVEVQISGASENTTNYLRIALFKPATTSYFGYTFNNKDWINSSTHSDYLAIPIGADGSWKGKVQGKLDSEHAGYKGPGDYALKVRRYTESGSYKWSEEKTIAIHGPELSPTPFPTPIKSGPTATSTPKPTATPKITQPKSSPTPTQKPTSTPPPGPITDTVTEESQSLENDVLSASTSTQIETYVYEEPTATPEAVKVSPENTNIFLWVLGALGIISIIFGIILAWRKKKQLLS